jgi:hypothetical protein
MSVGLKSQSNNYGNAKSINLIAKKRPPPMNVGYNEDGIDI